MDDAKTRDLLQQLSEIVFSIEKDIAELKVSVLALTAVAASQINPDNPSEGVAEIRALEDVARKADPSAEQRQNLADIIEAVKLIRKHGSHEI